MLEPGDIELIDDRMVIDGETDELVVWNRLKKDMVELSKTPTNKSSFQFPVFDEVETYLYDKFGRFPGEQHWPSDHVEVAKEAYDFIVGNKKH